MWKGKRIIGNATAIKALQKSLKKSIEPTPTPQTPDDDRPPGDDDHPPGDDLVSEPVCYNGYTLQDLKDMKVAQLNNLFGKEKGKLNLRGKPTTRGEMIEYLCAVGQNRRCKEPNWDCEDGLVCDASNQPDEGVCISPELADKRKGFSTIMWKGKRIIGNATAIKALQKSLKKSIEPTHVPDDDDDDRPPFDDDDRHPFDDDARPPFDDGDDDDHPPTPNPTPVVKSIKCESPDWCENGFCDVSGGYPGTCIPPNDDSVKKIKIDGKVITGDKLLLEKLLYQLGYSYDSSLYSFIVDIKKYYKDKDLVSVIGIEDFMFLLLPLLKLIKERTLTKNYVKANIDYFPGLSREDIYDNLYTPWMIKNQDPAKYVSPPKPQAPAPAKYVSPPKPQAPAKYVSPPKPQAPAPAPAKYVSPPKPQAPAPAPAKYVSPPKPQAPAPAPAKYVSPPKPQAPAPAKYVSPQKPPATPPPIEDQLTPDRTPPNTPDIPPKPQAPEPAKYVSPPKPQAPAPAKYVSPPKPQAPAPAKYVSPPKPQAPAPAKYVSPPKPQEPEPAKYVSPPKPQAPEPAKYVSPPKPQAPEPDSPLGIPKPLNPDPGTPLEPIPTTPERPPKQPSPKAPSPKPPSPKAPSPKAPSPKQPSPKAPSPKAPSPKPPSPKAPSPKPEDGTPVPPPKEDDDVGVEDLLGEIQEDPDAHISELTDVQRSVLKCLKLIA
jgi:hypothetical protein